MPSATSDRLGPVYFDSSALTKLCVNEPESRELERAVGHLREPLASRLVVVELLRAVKRRDPSLLPRAVELLGRLALITIDDRVLSKAVDIAPATLRSLDAIHIATALSLGLDLRAFITYDSDQAQAARALGLPVQSPGLD